jgi:signal transduction histidine kinase
MTIHRDHTPAAPPDSGIALGLPGGVAVLPVSPAGCRALAHAVIASMAPGGDPAAWTRAAEDPAVAAWLAAEGLGPAALPGGRPARLESLSLSARLRVALVKKSAAGGEATATADCGGLLLAALEAAETHRALVARFEERVAEARLDAVRELAYGAGHEINNPLANIAARAQALLLDEREPERRRRLATIVDQAFRARDMIGGLMLFARPPRAQPTATTVADLLRPVVEAVAARAAARQIRLEYSPAPGPLGIYVDATQVGEAVRLLATNAIEAVDDGGRVQVEASGGPAPTRARIVVGDDGPGMDPETAARACDPFFSGREAGRGIGLGLPKARRLIESSGGSLAIESRPGRGTRCIVDLPGLPPAA